MKTIDFVVRDSAGGLQRGTVSADASNQTIVAGNGQEISINARQSDFASQVRSGDQLVITLSDGRIITIDNFFNDDGAANRLFVSSDGYLNEVSFVDGAEGNLYAQYGPTSEWGKWSPSDELIFLGNSEVAGVPLADGDGEVSMLGAALLGGGGLGGLGAAAAGVGGLAVVGGVVGGGGGDSGNDGPVTPYVNENGTNVAISGDSAESITVTGGGEPGDTVVVTIGEESISTVIDDDGEFEAVFEGDDFPEDGVYASEVVVTDPEGDDTQLDGPSFEIDTTPPEITFTSGTDSNGDFVNEAGFDEDVSIEGTGEAGASLEVTIDGNTTTTVVGEDGTWTVTYPAGTFAAGEYTTGITAIATDSFGNSATFTETLVIDTVTSVTIDSTSVEGDDVVNKAEASDGVVLTGTGDAGATITVTMNGVSHDAVADASGNWEAFFSASEVAAGVYTAEITATIIDAVGNTRTATDSVEVDTRVDNLSVAADDIAVDNIINAVEADGNVTVTGTTEVGSTSVVVTMGGLTSNAVVDAEGNWSAEFDGTALTAGTYTADVGVTATDAAGNSRSISATVDVDTEVVPLDITSNSAGADQVVNAAEAAAGIDLGGTVEAGSTVRVTFDGTSYEASVDAAGNWSMTVPAGDVRGGAYAANISVEARDRAGNVATIEDTLSIDTAAPDGPVIASFTRDGDGIRGISIETEMENGAPTSDVQSLVQVQADGTISDVAGNQGFNTLRDETDFAFNENVPNGSQLIVNSTDAAGNTSGTFLVLDDEAATNSVDLTNMALGEYQIENLDLDFAEAASVVIDEASLLALSTNSNTLTIHGSGEDEVIIQGGVAQGTTVGDDGQTYNVYSVGAEGTLLVDLDIPVTI